MLGSPRQLASASSPDGASGSAPHTLGRLLSCSCVLTLSLPLHAQQVGMSVSRGGLSTVTLTRPPVSQPWSLAPPPALTTALLPGGGWWGPLGGRTAVSVLGHCLCGHHRHSTGTDSREAPLHVPSLDGFCPPVVSLGSLSMFSSRLTREPDLTLYPTITRVSLIPERYSLWGAGLRHLGWLCPWASPVTGRTQRGQAKGCTSNTDLRARRLQTGNGHRGRRGRHVCA